MANSVDSEGAVWQVSAQFAFAILLGTSVHEISGYLP